MLNNTKTDNSCSFNTKTDVHKSMSIRSSHSTEPQGKNPNHQMLFKNSSSVERKSNTKGMIDLINVHKPKPDPF